MAIQFIDRRTGEVVWQTEGNSLRGANLAGLDLTGAQLQGQDLTNANLAKSCLKGANLVGCTLWNVNLEDACLTGATVDQAAINSTIVPPERPHGPRLTVPVDRQREVERAWLTFRKKLRKRHGVRLVISR